MELLSLLGVGLMAGWLTGKIMRGAGYGVLADIVLGILGAVTGGQIVHWLGYPVRGGYLYSLGIATLGAVALTIIFRILTGRRVGI
ncbi:MAG TPA: GlsB/YeaQ/YmgE family stress response membrane protein [Terriglobia bacterium]|nr:GlsB/YeaQ/YmgE family stress response membrane protein [Terriglobia bacterium]